MPVSLKGVKRKHLSTSVATGTSPPFVAVPGVPISAFCGEENCLPSDGLSDCPVPVLDVVRTKAPLKRVTFTDQAPYALSHVSSTSTERWPTRSCLRSGAKTGPPVEINKDQVRYNSPLTHKK